MDMTKASMNAIMAAPVQNSSFCLLGGGGDIEYRDDAPCGSCCEIMVLVFLPGI